MPAYIAVFSGQGTRGIVVKIWDTRNGKNPWSEGFEKDTVLTKEAYDSLKQTMPYHDVFRIERDKK